MIILGIESSCDETSIAVLKDGKEILSNNISSQIEIHKEYGGVVPEIASRQHIKNIATVLEESLEQAKITLNDVDYIAVTYAPGLIGALLVGISFAKGLSYAKNIPIIPVHHIKGHMYANFLEHDVDLPCISLVVSGGHTNIIYIDKNHNFINIGETLDDAVGESCDKVARVLGLGYPGGPVIDKMYYKGNRNFLKITKPKVSRFDFSFSGIKTAIINFDNNMKMKSGVAANSLLRSQLTEKAAEKGIKVIYPSMKLCTDNAAMIAEAAYYKLKNSKNKEDCFAGLDLNGVASLMVSDEKAM